MLNPRAARIALSCLLTLCACSYEGPQPVAEDVVRPLTTSNRPTEKAEVESANRCLGLVQALEPLKRTLGQEALTRTSLDAVDPSVGVSLLKQAEQLEGNSGLPRSSLKVIQQRNDLTISSEAELERLAPEIRECVSRFAPSPAEPLKEPPIE
jgi:hypothetical protein